MPSVANSLMTMSYPMLVQVMATLYVCFNIAIGVPPVCLDPELV